MANDVSFDHRDYTATGVNAELDFIAAVLKSNPNVKIVKASMQEDMLEHWDYSFDSVKIDVKARRNIGILNLNHDKYTVLELKNRNGEKGWLYGKADYIAFEMITPELKCFIVVPRIELVKYSECIQDEFVIDQNDMVKKKYSGFNTKFVITAVPFDEIIQLPNAKILKK